MFKNFIPAFIWTIIVTGLSAMPGLPAMDWDLVSADKAGHFIAYAILAWLVCLGFNKNNTITYKNYLTAFIFSAGWGMLMEWMQGTFFPYRFFEWPDEIANAIGAILGIAAFHFFAKKPMSSSGPFA